MEPRQIAEARRRYQAAGISREEVAIRHRNLGTTTILISSLLLLLIVVGFIGHG